MHQELEIALSLAHRAGQEILKVYSGEFAVHEKAGDEGPVTVADHRADALIRAGLSAAFPSDALLTEETPDDLGRLTAERVWIVDPLDGTRQFVQRGNEFAVMIGLAVRGRAALGVVHLPCEDVTLAAADGLGCWLLRPGVPRERLVLAPLPEDPGELTATISRSHATSRTRRVCELLGARHIVPSGSVGRKAVLVATGKADVYVGLGRSRHWDACAPEVVVREAGGVFGPARGGEMLYNTVETRNRGLIACRAGLAERTIAAVHAVLDAPSPER